MLGLNGERRLVLYDRALDGKDINHTGAGV